MRNWHVVRSNSNFWRGLLEQPQMLQVGDVFVDQGSPHMRHGIARRRCIAGKAPARHAFAHAGMLGAAVGIDDLQQRMGALVLGQAMERGIKALEPVVVAGDPLDLAA